MFIIPIILTVAIAITGFIGYQKQQDYLTNLEQQIEKTENNLGSFYAVGGKYYRLWGNGINTTDTSIVLISFKSPINDLELAMSNFGEVGYGTIEPENTSNIEFIAFTGITQDGSSDKATLTGVTRGLNFVYPYNSSTTLAKSHSGGSRFIISNPPMLYGEYTAKKNAETIWGDWTFSATNTPQYGSAPTFNSGSNEFVTVKKAEEMANAGAATMSTTTPGLGLVATSRVLESFSTTTGYASSTPWLLRAFDAATSTDKRGATTTIMMTDVDGKVDQSFLDFTEDWTWSGNTVFNSTTSFNASTTLFATTTIGNSSSDNFFVNASTTFRNTTTTFDRPPSLDRSFTDTNATSSDFYSLITVGHALNPFGSFYEAKGWDVTYGPATSTGFVIGSEGCTNAGGGCYINVEAIVATTTDMVGSTIRTKDNDYAANANVAGNANVLMIVPIGHYWHASGTPNGGSTEINNGLWWVQMK